MGEERGGDFLLRESQKSRALTSRRVQSNGGNCNRSWRYGDRRTPKGLDLSRKRIILLAPRGNQDGSTLWKNITLHLAKHTQFITLQTGTSVRETSTLKHGSKYWKLHETLGTFLLCFLNAGSYFASLSSIFVS